MSSSTKTLISLLALHVIIDCFSSIWPIYKHLVSIPLGEAGLIVTIASVFTYALQPMFGAWADSGHARWCVIVGTLFSLPMMLLGPMTAWLTEAPVFVTYSVLFTIVCTARLGQAIYHPAGAMIAGEVSPGSRSGMLSLFVAFGWIGYGSSQAVFSSMYEWTDAHTEWLLIPGALVIVFSLFYCLPKNVPNGQIRKGLIDSIRQVPWTEKRLLHLFFLLAMMSGLAQGFFFLLPEFFESYGYPKWVVNGGGLIMFVAGSALFIIPVGYAADHLGRKKMLMLSILATIVSYYWLIFWPPKEIFGLGIVCFLTGGAISIANPVGVAIGQHLFPNKSSIISGVLMGLAWSLGYLAPWIVGLLVEHRHYEVPDALGLLGAVSVGALVLSFFIIDEPTTMELRETN
jgi:FSR family fosmidomycin resistance protein-like MFS transporter